MDFRHVGQGGALLVGLMVTFFSDPAGPSEGTSATCSSSLTLPCKEAGAVGWRDQQFACGSQRHVRDRRGELFGPLSLWQECKSSWCRAEGQKVPTVVPYDRDKVSLLPEGVSLVNLESTLGDYARDVKLACFHSGTTPCLTVRRRSSRSRHGFLRDLAQRDSYWSEPPLSDRPRYCASCAQEG